MFINVSFAYISSTLKNFYFSDICFADRAGVRTHVFIAVLT